MNNSKICPITYEPITSDERYSHKGLRKISRSISHLEVFPYSAEQQRKEALQRADKISIQGIQPKLSVKFDAKIGTFKICDLGGKYIIKPQSPLYEELPENEDLSMRLARCLDIEVPFHGLLYCADKSFSYFIKRFDRIGKGKKLALEDFAQLSHLKRDSKYDFSMEKIINVIDRYCTFPVIEKKKLFALTIFNFLIGNEDMHLKNLSLITNDNKIMLSPCYDLINTTLALQKAKEEIALSLNGKKRNLNYKDLVQYYGHERLKLSDIVIEKVLAKIKTSIPEWKRLIGISFLSNENKTQYLELLGKRAKVLNL